MVEGLFSTLPCPHIHRLEEQAYVYDLGQDYKTRRHKIQGSHIHLKVSEVIVAQSPVMPMVGLMHMSSKE